MTTADEFLSLFDERGRFRAGDGAVNVVFLTNGNHRYRGKLEFEGGLCVSADMEGSQPWVYPDRSPLGGLRLKLAFDKEEPLVVVINDGRLLPLDALHADARLAEAFEQADRAGIALNQRARTALLSLSPQEQITVLEAVVRLAKRPPDEWSPEVATRLAEETPVYLLTVSEDLRAFLRVVEGRQEQIELLDVVREATLQAFMERSRVTSGAK